MRRKKSIWGKLLTWIVMISLIVVAGNYIIEVINAPCTDVTGMVDMETEKLESTLGITMVRDSNMYQKINHYSKGNVSTDSDTGIGVVYVDGKQVGLHIDSRKYSMYGLHIGDTDMSVDRKTTYKYEDAFEVYDDMVNGTSTATFYYNNKNNDCLVVICNDRSSRVVALTYFKDMKKMTEQLNTKRIRSI